MALGTNAATGDDDVARRVAALAGGRMTGPLAGKVAIVTGASRGIGKGCALELGAAGATVYVTGRSTSEADHPLPGTIGATAQEIDALGWHGRSRSRSTTATTTRSRPCSTRVLDEHGRLDVLVNNAFIVTNELTSGLPFWEVPISNWDDMIDVGTRSAYVASVFAARAMTKAGSGLIANISSSGAEEYAWQVAYGVGKCALDRITADTAHELERFGVSVVSLWPGFVRTERIDVGAAAGLLPESLDLGTSESPRFTGRAVVALATDPDVARWTGRAVVGPRPRRRVRLHRRRRPPPRRPPPPPHRVTSVPPTGVDFGTILSPTSTQVA